MVEGIQDLAHLERSIDAIASVGKVMKAVWALARAQQPMVDAAAAEATAYLDAVDALVDRLAGAPAPVEAREDVLWVLVGPERAFCGPLARLLLEQVPSTGTVGLVGARLIEVAEQDPELEGRLAFQLPGATTPEDLGARSEELATAILDAQPGTVVVLAPEDGTTRLHQTVLLSGRREPAGEPPETFSPVREVLEAAVVEAVAGRLAVALAEALRAEVRARLEAAEAARLACDRQTDELRHRWRSLRQSAITQELVELTSGRSRRR